MHPVLCACLRFAQGAAVYKAHSSARQAINWSFNPCSLYTLKILNLFQKEQNLRYPQLHNAYANL